MKKVTQFMCLASFGLGQAWLSEPAWALASPPTTRSAALIVRPRQSAASLDLAKLSEASLRVDEAQLTSTAKVAIQNALKKVTTKAHRLDILRCVNAHHPRIRWKMPPRFGLDNNGDGLPDLPNSVEYVHNRRAASGSATLLPDDLFDVTIFDQDTAAALASASLQWTLKDSNGLSLAIPASSPSFTLPLAEGSYVATLRSQKKCPHGVTSEKVVEKKITVNDILIVALGDSYMSGEGAPERAKASGGIFIGGPNHDVRWADSGGSVTTVHWVDGSTSSVVGDATGIGHVKAHRSTLAWAPQMAMRLERADDESSVTFIHLAVTGATISKGLLGPAGGSSQEGIAGQAPAQLELARQLVGQRKIDALILGIGGNDIGFSNLIKGLVLRGTWSDIDFRRLKDALQSGNWKSVRNNQFNETVELFADLTRAFPAVSIPDAVGFKRLPAEFQKLADSLGQLDRQGMKVGRVYLASYPDPTHKKNGEFCREALEEIGDEVGVTLHIDENEFRWAYNNVIVPLNDLLQRQAELFQWTFLADFVNTTKYHGICREQTFPFDLAQQENQWPEITQAGDWRKAWFRDARNSFYTEGIESLRSTMGTAHPNKYGYAALADAAYSYFESLLVAAE
jgi:lysophospholipase L1-like esterase